MGGEECVIVIAGSGLQGEAYKLITTAQASCALVNYLSLDDGANFDPADAKAIGDFHLKNIKTIRALNEELDRLNHELAHKYEKS